MRVDDPRRARAGPPAASASTGRAARRRRGRTRSRRPRPASTVASKMPKPAGSSAWSAPSTRSADRRPGSAPRRGTPCARCAAGTRPAGAGRGTRPCEATPCPKTGQGNVLIRSVRRSMKPAASTSVATSRVGSPGRSACSWSTTVRPRHGPWVTSISTGRCSVVMHVGPDHVGDGERIVHGRVAVPVDALVELAVEARAGRRPRRRRGPSRAARRRARRESIARWVTSRPTIVTLEAAR